MHAIRCHRITHRFPRLRIHRPVVAVEFITPRHHFIPLLQRLRSRFVIPVRPAIRPRKLRLHQLPLGFHFVRLAIPPVLVIRIVRIIGYQIPQLHLPVVVRRRPDFLHPHRLPELLHRNLRRLRRLNHRLHLRRCRRHRRIIHKHRRRHLHHSPVHQIPRPVIHQPVITHRRRRRHVPHPEMLAPEIDARIREHMPVRRRNRPRRNRRVRRPRPIRILPARPPDHALRMPRHRVVLGDLRHAVMIVIIRVADVSAPAVIQLDLEPMALFASVVDRVEIVNAPVRNTRVTPARRAGQQQ